MTDHVTLGRPRGGFVIATRRLRDRGGSDVKVLTRIAGLSQAWAEYESRDNL
jgi:hypothetical protein